jgi:hypothetical protein
MLHKIVIENFFSIAERQTIDLRVPGNAPDLSCFRPSRALPEERLPTVVGFFGPNASGKSTVLRAVIAAAAFARDSFSLAVSGPIPWFQPFMRRDWWGRPTIIIVDFDGQLGAGHPPAVFRYELHIAHDADYPSGYPMAKAVAFESLSYAPKGKFRRLYERQAQNFRFGKKFEISEGDARTQSIRSNASVISTLAKLNHNLSTYFSDALAQLQTNILGLDKAQTHPNSWLTFLAANPSYLENLKRELRRLDVGLEDMSIIQGDAGPFAAFKHEGLDASILMNEESAGTRRFIDVFPRLNFALEAGGVAIFDEIDTDMHPLLMPEIFRWFSDTTRNPHGAQLFFTAHNPALLDELEKEQIFLTEKGRSGSTEVIGVRDIKGLRREPSIMKKYLAGELGGVPYIG